MADKNTPPVTAPAAAPTYAKIPGKNLQLLRSDGTRVHVNSKEVKAAREEGRAPATDATAAHAPKVVRRPSATPPKSKAATKADLAVEYGALAGMFFGAFAYGSHQSHWELAADEEKALGGALASALPTLPGGQFKRLEKASPWIKLALVSGKIVVPRLLRNATPAPEPAGTQTVQHPVETSYADRFAAQRAAEGGGGDNGNVVHITVPKQP